MLRTFDFSRGLNLRASLAELDGWEMRGAKFGHDTSFSFAAFGNKASFFDATFADRAMFWQAMFGDKAIFNGANFGKVQVFDGVTFGKNADFAGATFGKDTFLRAASFVSVFFEDALFEGRFDADGANFLGPTSFRAAEIKGHAGFAGCTWPAKAEDHEGAFEGCRFRDVADFKTKGFKAFALFDGAEFKGRVLLKDPGGPAEDALFGEALQATTEAAKAKLAHADTRFSALAGGLRTLKLAMAAQGDRDREQRFFRYEVQARAKRPHEGPLAKVAARLYGITSSYGASIGRPLAWIAGVWLFFAALYGAFGLGTGLFEIAPTAEGVVQALELSLANSFKPFFLFDTPRPENQSFWAELLRRNDGVSLLMRAAGVAQSIATVILLFLAGLALKRKFQIG